MRTRSVFFVWTLMCALAASAFAQAKGSKIKAKEKPPSYYELMKEFVDIFEQIDRSYVKDVDRRKLMQAAVRGMLQELDPYSAYIGKKQMQRFTEEVEQQFGGIGIHVQLDPKTHRLTVMSPLPGTPAYSAGVKAGDVIESIDGKSTKGFSITDAVKLMRGKPGDAVMVGLRRADTHKLDKVKIVRAVIEVPTVLGDKYDTGDRWNFMLDPRNKIGYVRLSHFSRRSAEELREALDDLKGGGVKGLILDLRFNPGGLLSQATEIADMFIEKGRIVSTKGRNTHERVWEATRGGTRTGFPMAVLVNRFSASASEIVSACLQDHKRAVIVGERTWGKGSVQNVLNVGDGSSALKLTTASYHRPSGKNIHRFPDSKNSDDWGVVPDEGCRVRFSLAEMRKYYEHRQKRDVLSPGGPPESDFKDRQLDLALTKVREKLGVKSGAVKAKKPATRKASTPQKKTSHNDPANRRIKLVAWYFAPQAGSLRTL